MGMDNSTLMANAAYPYAKPLWLYTLRNKETKELHQIESSEPVPRSAIKPEYEIYSALKTAGDYSLTRHDLAICLAKFRCHP